MRNFVRWYVIVRQRNLQRREHPGEPFGVFGPVCLGALHVEERGSAERRIDLFPRSRRLILLRGLHEKKAAKGLLHVVHVAVPRPAGDERSESLLRNIAEEEITIQRPFDQGITRIIRGS